MKFIINEIPSSNNKYQGRGMKGSHRAFQAEKRLWEQLVWAEQKKPTKPLEQAEVNIRYYFQDARRRDPDNYAGKVILDALKVNEIIEDDSFNNVRVKVEGYIDRKNPRTEIEVIKSKWEKTM